MLLAVCSARILGHDLFDHVHLANSDCRDDIDVIAKVLDIHRDDFLKCVNSIICGVTAV